MTSEKSDIRAGDRVTVSLCVERVHADYLELRLVPNDVAQQKGGGTAVAVNLRAVIDHTPHPLEAGAAVKFAGNPDSIRGQIQHIIGDRAWVRWSSSETYDEVVPLFQIERENRAALLPEDQTQ